MLIEIVCATVPVLTYITFDKRKSILGFVKSIGSKPNITTISQKNVTNDPKFPDIGLSYEEYVLNETEEEYLTRLKRLHSCAWSEFSSYICKRELNERNDMLLAKSILDARDNKLKYEVDKYHIKFDNGVFVWIENRWFGFGGVTSTTGVKTHSSDAVLNNRVSDYTWMMLVDFYEEITDFDNWKRKHDEYTTNMLSRK